MKKQAKSQIFANIEFPKVYALDERTQTFYPELKSRMIHLYDKIGIKHLEKRVKEIETHLHFIKGLTKEVKYCLFDTETTGKETEKHDVIEFALTSHEDEILVNELYNSDTPIDSVAQSIHNISKEDIKDKKYLIEDIDRIIEIMNQYEVAIAYNYDFDKRIINSTLLAQYEKIDDLREFNIKCESVDPIEVLAHLAFKWNDSRNNFRWLKLGGLHRAYEDCIDLNKWLKFAAEIDFNKVMATYEEAIKSIERKSKSKKS